MIVTLYPTPLTGTISAPSSKSITHRAMICAAIAKGTSEIINPLLSEDTIYTIKALEKLGVKFTKQPSKVTITSPKRFVKISSLDCGESGSTIRFLIPLIVTLQQGATFRGSKRLIERINEDDLRALGLDFIKTPNTINILMGNLKEDLVLNTDHSTQLVSGILLASPLFNKQINILLQANKLDPYLLLTIKVLEQFGVNIEAFLSTDGISLKTLNQLPQPTTLTIEGDYTAAANLLVMGMLGKGITINNLCPESFQGDKNIINILKDMNAKINLDHHSAIITSSRPKAISIDLSLNPDLAPLLMGLASVSKGTTKITGLNRLYYKESNRVDDTIALLHQLGAKITKTKDTIIITGQETLMGGITVDSYNDHRLVLMVCAISSKLVSPITIINAQVVNKSYPNFWDDFFSLGAKFTKEEFDDPIII